MNFINSPLKKSDIYLLRRHSVGGGIMKVVLVAHYLDESVGFGMDRYAFKLLNGLRERGLNIIAISSTAKFISPLKSLADFFIYLPFRSILPAGGPDIYHFVAPQAGIAIPFIKKLHKKKVVTTIYDLTPFLEKDKNKGAFLLVSKALECAITHSDMLLVISSQTKNDLLKYFKVDESKVRITLLAADRKFQPIQRERNKEFTVGYVGGFAGYKNVPFLVKAYSIFEKKCKTPSKLVLYGKGPEYNYCQKLAAELRIRNVEFRGFADEKDLVKIYNSFDVFVFPSTIEGFGLPIIEAEMCRVPVIVKDGAHVPEEVTRFCPKAKDESHLATLLEQIRSNGFEFSKEHVRHLESFSWNSCIEQTILIYQEILKN
jgi:glycosyltransferase involved in cell wall biosynthesis